MTSNLWLVFALLSALFAALTSIFAKVGIEGVNSTLATALRTIVVLIMAWGMVFITKTQGGIDAINTKSWVFLILSGLAADRGCLQGRPGRQNEHRHNYNPCSYLPSRNHHRKERYRMCSDCSRYSVDGAVGKMYL